jgi:DNA-binding response OmpR family regulator
MTAADPPRVPLVEDDAVLGAFLTDNLAADGFELLGGDGVRDELRLLEYEQPDLALVELALPDGSGLDLIARVRRADGLASRLDPDAPLVVLTA